ncbi:hypothetical protein IJ425_07050 [bacterium]|nr:hypothetical protein [bacterium]
MLKNEFNDNQETIEIMGKYKNRYISKTEAGELLIEINQRKCVSVLSVFKDKYGAWPVSIHKYEEGKDFIEE